MAFYSSQRSMVSAMVANADTAYGLDNALTNLIPWHGPIAPQAHLHTDAPTLDLSGIWRFQLVDSPCDTPTGFTDPQFDDNEFVDLTVPSCWQMVDPAGDAPFGRPAYLNVNYPIPIPASDEDVVVPDENPTGCYRHTFEVGKDFTDAERVLLRFEGVDSFARVWLNGTELGWTKGSRLTSEFDVTAQLHPGRNVLAAAVSQWSDGTFLEDQDMWRMSGIFREVTLLARPHGGIDDLFVHAAWEGDAKLLIDGPDGATVTIPELAVTTTCNTEVTIPDVQPWTAETPRLYDATVSTDTETVTVKIGFRTVAIDGDIITVNGGKIVFRGVNRHEWHPRTERTLDEETMRADLELMKRHGVNAIRTSHYPPNARFLDLCDEYGMWVILENDLETHGFECSGWDGNPTDDDRCYDCLLNRIQRTVERDKNHPAIIGWSMGNESHCGEGIRLMNEWVKDRDPSRFTHYEGGTTPTPSAMCGRSCIRPWSGSKPCVTAPSCPGLSLLHRPDASSSCRSSCASSPTRWATVPGSSPTTRSAVSTRTSTATACMADSSGSGSITASKLDVAMPTGAILARPYTIQTSSVMGSSRSIARPPQDCGNLQRQWERYASRSTASS